MPKLDTAILGTLTAAALALVLAGTTGTAHAADDTATWCRDRGAADQTILTGPDASLVWRADGDLVMEPMNGLAAKVWSSGTAGIGQRLCYGTGGSLTVRDAAGAPRWFRPAPPPPLEPTLRHRATMSVAGCSLATRYVITVPVPAFGVFGALRQIVWSEGEVWRQDGTCPVAGDTAVADGWCLDNRRERTLLQNDWASLVWGTDGNLVLRGRDAHAGVRIWHSDTVGAGLLCFAPTGRLEIRDHGGASRWSTPAGATTTSHMLGLDGCDLAIDPLDGTARMWSRPQLCPQARIATGRTFSQPAADRIVVQNDDAELVFDTTGNLVLRTRAGVEMFTSKLAPGTGRRLAFQADGNLVIYDAANQPLWAPNTHDQGVGTLELVGCSFALRAAGTTRWTRGWESCATTQLRRPGGWSMSNTGETTILRAEESRLVWQADGNLVLYTTRGTPVWSTDTWGRGQKLALTSGMLVVTDGADRPLWFRRAVAPDFNLTLRLGDRCKLELVAAGSATTLNDGCNVAKRSFQKIDGDDDFGSALRSDVTATDDATGQAANSATGLDVTIFGNDREMLSVTSTQHEGGSAATTAVTVFGNATVSAGITLPPMTFFSYEQTFMAGPVPVTVSAGATGEIAVALAWSGGELSLTPSAGLYATVSAGVGGGCDVIGASAGIRGSLTLIEVALPIALKVFRNAEGAMAYALRSDLVLASLSGAFELYAEGHIDVYVGTISAEWTEELFSWDGVEWTKELFSITGTF